MILGLGNDIIEVERIKKAIARHGTVFITRIFTPSEIAYCTQYAHAERHFAGRFAAKEAIVKALGCGFGERIGFLDIEITNDAKGKPVVALSEKCAPYFDRGTLLISISHCQAYAAAVAIYTGGH